MKSLTRPCDGQWCCSNWLTIAESRDALGE
jgi:hypothetical protein